MLALLTLLRISDFHTRAKWWLRATFVRKLNRKPCWILLMNTWLCAAAGLAGAPRSCRHGVTVASLLPGFGANPLVLPAWLTQNELLIRRNHA